MAKRSQNWMIWGLGAVVAIGAAMVGIMWPVGSYIAVNHAHQIDGQTLLVVGSSGSDTDTKRWSRIGLMGTDGVVQRWVQEEGALDVIGVTEEIVWLNHPQHGVHARRLGDLKLIPEIGDAIRSHDVLTQRFQVEGYSADFVLARGIDGKRYTIGRDAAIARAPKEIDYVMRNAPLPRASVHDGDQIELKAAATIVKSNDDFTHPLVVTADGRTAVSLLDPPSFLVRSSTFIGGVFDQSLSRVTLTGEVRWSTSTSALADLVTTDRQTLTLVWVGRLGGDLSALLQLSEHFDPDNGDDYSEHSHQLVKLDAATGNVLKSTTVTLAEQG